MILTYVELNGYPLNLYSRKFKVSSHKIPHYFRWIRKYIELTDKIGLSDNTRDKFLKEISALYPAWKVEQADKAIAIYLSFMRKNDESNAINVIFNMKEEIRLQNKSLKTERSYIYWAKKFSEFTGNKTPGVVNQDDVKAFLTYLAVEKSVAIST